jgi:predicted acyltransferase
MRLASLDVFRGLTVAGMILVNIAGVSENVYFWAAHAKWNGWTLADTVFPFFLFAIGVAMAFSFARYLDGREAISGEIYTKIVKRCLVLFALGLLLNFSNIFFGYDWGNMVNKVFINLRFLGILQRIAIAYLIAAIVILKVPQKGQWAIAGGGLLLYWLSMRFGPVPDSNTVLQSMGDVTGEDKQIFLEKLNNFGAYVDRLFIPKTHLYKGGGYKLLGDPEGIFGSVFATINVLFGYFTGSWIKRQNNPDRLPGTLVMAGLAALVVGQISQYIWPINKGLWTSSYMIFMTGLALLLLAACIYLVDIKPFRKWFQPFEWMGLNPLIAFIGSVLLLKFMAIHQAAKDVSVFQAIEKNIFGFLGNYNSGLVFAIVHVLFWMGVCYLLHRKKMYFKV